MYKGTVRQPIMVIVFSIISCGIYMIYWLYKTHQDVNAIMNREQIPMWAFLVAFLVPFGYLYYFYQVDLAMKEVAPNYGINWNSNNFVIWIVCAFLGLGGLVAMFQTQDALNTIWSRN